MPRCFDRLFKYVLFVYENFIVSTGSGRLIKSAGPVWAFPVGSTVFL